MNCLILEDDLQTLEKVVGYVKSSPELTLAGACSSVTESIDIFNKKSIDLLLLDVELGGDNNGLDFYKVLKQKPLVIVMTSHSQYAAASYAEQLAGFLPKPFGFPQFRKVLEHVLSLDKMQKLAASVDKIDTGTGNFIPIKTKSRQLAKIFFRDITYFEQTKQILNVHTIHNEHHVLKRTTMNEIEASLPLQLFQRINKSVIVNKTFVDQVIMDTVVIGDASFPISPKYKLSISVK